MQERASKDGRVRAWVLVRADSPEEVAGRLYEELKDEGGDGYVVVRADVLEDSSHDIVIPVDALDRDQLNEVLDTIDATKGVRGRDVLLAEAHVPYPPHVAQAYVTEDEYKAQLEQEIEIEAKIRPGRQGQSPGLNPWG